MWLFALDEVILPFIIAASFSVFFGVLFLYMFSHEDFFKFAKEIERKQKKSEKIWERKFLQYGKITTIFVIAIVGGPILAALAIRFLLSRYKHKYLLIIAAMTFSTALVWFITKAMMLCIVEGLLKKIRVVELYWN